MTGTMWRTIGISTVGFLGLAGLPCVAAEVGDAARGAVLAERWCATCHVVAPGQAEASADAPSFAGLAAASGKTPEGIADFLTLPGTTHSKMPDLHLSRVEILDVVAYIGSLKK